MKNESLELEARIQREKDAWNNDDIMVAQNAFKNRIIAAIDNPHVWEMEAERNQLVRNKCAGSVVLDLGCYIGHEAQKYLDYGASYVYGIDISDEGIKIAQKSIKDKRAEFMVADAHNLPFEANTFDLIVGRAILHHLDLKNAYEELSRILKPGGMALFVEPLRGNPLAKMVRLLTPKARTNDELPLCFRDIKLGNDVIGSGHHRFSGFISSPLGAVVSLCGGFKGNWIMKLAAIGDDIVSHTPLKYWGRLVYLNFEKR